LIADEPKDAETSETQEETAQDETAVPAGPVAEEGTPPSPGGEPTSTPPAEEASGSEQASAEEEGTPAEAEAEQAQDEAPAEEQVQGDAPAGEPAEAPAAEQEDAPAEAEPAEEPKAAEKKKDVIPGADLEPISVEPKERPLSAEEQARREAEEEERRQREAALAGEDEEPSPASRAPAKIEADRRFLATGKRKHAIARVILLPGGGEFVVNGRPLEEFFPRPLHQTIARQPLVTTGYEGNVDVRVRVSGGGVSGQAGAVRHGIARALIEVDPDLRIELKRRGYLTRDARVKERRKAGLKKARKRPQFSKR
jgi:small subunit ribosomal protein S9